jgi:hypothetical protein
MRMRAVASVAVPRLGAGTEHGQDDGVDGLPAPTGDLRRDSLNPVDSAVGTCAMSSLVDDPPDRPGVQASTVPVIASEALQMGPTLSTATPATLSTGRLE